MEHQWRRSNHPSRPMKLHKVLLATAAIVLVPRADAAFHLMQIEQVIGSVDGNTAAQAITLRLRSAGQTVLGGTRLLSFDAAGLNPIVLFDFTTSFTGNGSAGRRILLTTSAFDIGMLTEMPTFDSDFTLTNPIPAARLAGGKISFTNDSGLSLIWSLAYGAYTGTNLGDGNNDTDFGAPEPSPLPSTGRRGIHYPGGSPFASTNNAADYQLTPNPATVINNANQSFTVVPEPGSAALVMLGALALGGSVFSRRRYRGGR
jgi:hypothetical protein